MSTFFQANLPNGTVQISDQNINFELVSKTTLGTYFKKSQSLKLKTTDSYVNFSGTAYCYAKPSTNNLLFIGNPTTNEVGIITKTMNLTQWTTAAKHTFVGINDVIIIFNTTREIADGLIVYEFSANKTQLESGMGFECYDDNGQLCFTSNQSPLKVIQSAIELNVALSNNPSRVRFATQTYTPVNTVFNKNIGYWSPYANFGGGGSSQSNSKAPVAFLTNNSLKMRLVKYGDTNISITYNVPNYIQDAYMGTNSYATAYTVVDVTNI